MVWSVADIAALMVGSHRRLGGLVPKLARVAGDLDGPTSMDTRVDAARCAAGLLDRNLLVHADIEEMLVHDYLGGPASRGGPARLQPQHDTLREATTRLHDYMDAPTEDTHVAGMLHGVTTLLASHLIDEWRILRPALSSLDDTGAIKYESLLAGAALPEPNVRWLLPLEFTSARRQLVGHHRQLSGDMSSTATTAVLRRAHRAGMALRDDVEIVVDLDPAVQSIHVDLHVARLRSNESHAVFSPIDVDVVVSSRRHHHTAIEMYLHTASAQPSFDVAGHEMARTAVHAVIEQLVDIVAGTPVANPTIPNVIARSTS